MQCKFFFVVVKLVDHVGYLHFTLHLQPVITQLLQLQRSNTGTLKKNWYTLFSSLIARIINFR